MVRTVVTPDNQNILIKVPENYVGKQVEVIAFATDETVEGSFEGDRILTHFASEKVLAKEWLSPEEDKAWQSL